jgi:catechol 2,3-dioxygenase-like lactoylglutathione lyase family enzyme
MPSVTGLDHLVLTVADVARTVAFYESVLGMRAAPFSPADGSTRWALAFGAQKINLHAAAAPFAPHARAPVPGSADLCFLSDTPIATWQDHFALHNVPVTCGPVRRTGATGPLISLYISDPDGNLIELSNQL